MLMSFIDDILEPKILGIPVISIVVALFCSLILLLIFDESVRYLQNFLK